MQASCDSPQRCPRLGDTGHCGLHVQRRDQCRSRSDHIAHQGCRKFTGERSNLNNFEKEETNNIKSKYTLYVKWTIGIKMDIGWNKKTS